MSTSRIVGNIAPGGGTGVYIVLASATLNNNWWGCNGGPGASGCDTILQDVSGNNVAYTPSSWLVLSVSAGSTQVDASETTGLTADLTHNSADTGGFSVPNGTPVSFGATMGTISGASTTLTNGTGTATFTAGTTAGAGSGTTTVDNQTVSVTIDVVGGTTTTAAVDDAATNGTWTNAEVAGASAYGTATVTPGGSGPTPTGSVTYTFYSGSTCTSTVVGTSTATLSGGSVPKSSTVGPLGAGTYSLSASYGGDPAHQGSSNGCSSFTVGKAQPTTSVGSSPNPSTPGQSVTLTATVSGGYSPTGTVGFTSNGVAITNCTSVGLSSGQAQCMTSSLATGTDAIVATYSGDGNNMSSPGTLSGGQNVQASTVSVTIGTSPAGLGFMIGSNSYTMAQTQSLTVGTPYTLATTSPQNLGITGVQYVFSAWSSGTVNGTDSVSLTPTATTTSDTAMFTTQYLLTVNAGTGGTIAAATAPNGFYNAATSQTIAATPNAGYYFSGWTGANSPTDIARATNATTTVTMNAPETVTANFAPIPSYIVGTTADDASGDASNCPASPSIGSSCTLRDALAAAATTSGGNITFSATAFPTTNTAAQNTITLAHGFLAIPNMTSIQGLTSGSGATLTNLVTVSGNSASAVFTVASGVTASLANLTIAKGSESSLGGGIATAGNLTISESTFSSNTAGGGGAIFNTGTLVVTGSAFVGNTTTDASGDGGAGIYNEATATVTNCTFSGNNAGTPTEEGEGGDGVSSSFGTMNVTGSTFAGNKGAIDVMDWGGTINVKNSILTEGTDNLSAFSAFPGTVNADHDLFVSDSDACSSCATNTSPVTASSASVATLGNYGGPTQTLLPLPGSAAICAATAADDPGGDTTDERGFPRTTTYNSTACIDLGADQTNYALSFTTDPPATGTAPGTAMTPAPVVTVTENGSALTAGTASLSATDANADLTTTPATATTSATNGEASFGSLLFTSTTTDDTLTATLVLNSSNTAINLTTSSTSFSVGAISAPLMTAQFGAPSIPLGGSTTLTFTIENQNEGTALNGVGFTNALPAGLSFASGSSNCGGTVNFSPPSTATFSGGIIPANSECQVVVEVTATSPGEQSDTSGAVTSSNGGTGNTVSVGINVLAPSLSVSKTHTGTFTEGSTAVWTIQVSNTATGSTTSGAIDVSDTLPTNYTLASYTSTGSAWTCTGTGTGTVGCSSTTPITGGSSSTITLTVNVPYNSAASVSNTALAWGGSDPIQNSSGTAASSTDSSVPVVQVTTPNFVVTTLTDDPPGDAADCPVGNSPASNDCTLRDAMLAANAIDGGYGNITFSTGLKGTIDLTSVTPTALPELTGQITITGPGANVITVSGNNSSTVGRIFAVGIDAIVGISGLTIANGNAPASGGAGIYNNNGTVTVSSCELLNNSASDHAGAGIFSDGSLTVENSTFSGNSTPDNGGGIYVPAGTLTVTYSTFSGNTAGASGGAIITDGPATISNSTFSANQAGNGGGGAIANGGLYAMTVANSIFSGNSANTGAGLLNNVSGTLNASYNLYYQNYDTSTTNEDDCDGCTSNTNDVTGQNPNLAALANYGGPTPTMLPLPASAAICAASSALIPAGVMMDQRGDPNTNSTYYGYSALAPCVDVGAVQTNYSVSFSTEPQAISPATEIYTSTNFEAGVTLDESGAPFTAVAETIPLTLDGTGTVSGGSATTNSGVASYSTLQVNTAGTGDMLNADLALNPAASPAPVAYAQSNGFNVGSPVSPSLSVTVTNAGTFTQGGSSGVLEITVTNSAVGSTTGSNAITVQGVLPSGTNNGHSWNYQLISNSGTGWSCGGPGGSCSYSLPVTGGNSTSTLMITVQVPNTSPATVPYSVSAYGGGDPVHTNSGTAVSSNTDNIAVLQVPATVAITAGGTQSAPINSAFATPLTVLVTDAAGVGIPSQSVTFTAPPSAASGTFSNSTAAIIGTTASTGTVGQLAETFTANGTAGGPYSVTAIASTVSASPAFALTNLTATAMVTTWPTASAITYGQPLSASMLSGGVASVAGSFAFAFPLTVPGAGTQSESVTFTPTSSSYSPVSQNVSVLVNKATPTVTWPTASPINSGQMLSASTLSGGSAVSPITAAVVQGKFAFTSPSTKPPAGTNPQPVMFTPTDTTDYNTVTSTVSVTVNGLAVTVTKWPKASAITYGQPLSDSTLSGGKASVAGSFTFTNPGTVPAAGTHSESVTFTPTNSAYEMATSTVSVTVYQGTPTVTWPTASAINSGQMLSASTLSGGSAISPITDAVVLGSFAFTYPTTTPSSTGPESVTFTPSDATDYESVTGTVTVTVNGGGVPVASISTTSINFGTLYLGSIVTKTVTVKNVGGAPMTISDPLIAIVSGGNSDEFITVNLCPKSLAAGKSCTMTVTFVAGPFYNPQTATLTISDNAAGSPQKVMLYATVIDPVAQLNSGSLSFGTVKVGKSSSSQSVTLSNPGGTALTGIGIGVGGADPNDFAESDNCPATLQPKKSCTISVTFQPTAKKSRTASVTINDNAQNSPQSISLSGTGN
jgi:CSLREA domain-containing protein